MSRIRPLGDITLDLEDVVSEMVEDHDLQHGEVLALVKAYLEIHFPEAKEEYEDGNAPYYYYGHPDHIRNKK